MTTTLSIEGTAERLKAEIHEDELFLSIQEPGGHVQRVPSMEAAIGRIFPDAPLARRVCLAGELLAALAGRLG